ncbi:hypothetical protein [Streptomyces sp. DSM 41013]
MSEWNLSVRLTGQGSNLRSTLKGVSRDARDASQRVNELKRDVAELRRVLAMDTRLRLDVDLHADRTALRAEVEDAISWAQRGQRIEIPITLQNPMQLRRDVSDAVRWASMNQVIRVRVTPDTSGLRTPLPTLGGGSGGASAAATDTVKALGSLLPVATALIPLVAGLTPAVMSAAGSMGIGALAAGAYGAALAGQIGPLKEAAEAEKAYQDAVTEHGAGSRQAAQAQLAYQRQLSSMPPETQKAAVALSRLKTEFGDWSDGLAGFTMEPVTKGMALVGEILPHLTPEVKAFSGSMDRLVTVAGGAINTPGFESLADRVAELTESKLDDFTDQVIHLMRILSEGGTDAGVIGRIIQYMRENGPAAREALNSIGDAVVNVVEASSQAGPTMLTLVTAVADLVAAMPPQAVAVILQAAVALKLLTIAGAAGTAAAGGITAVRAAILGMAAASTAAGGGLAGLRAAFLSLGTAAKASIVVAGIGLAVYALHELSAAGKEAPADLDKVTSSLKRFQDAGKLTGESARVFGKDFEKLGDSVQKVSDPEGLDQFQQSLTSFFGMDSTPVKDAAKNIDDFDEGLANLVKNGNADQAKATLDGAMASLRAQGKDVETFRNSLDGYDEAVADLAYEQEHAAGSMSLFGKAAADVQAQLSAQKTAADGLRESLIALNETNRDAYSAEIGFEQAVDDLTASFKEHGSTLDLNTEAGRRNGEAMATAAQSQDELIAAGIAAGESFETMTGKTDKLRESMLVLATKAFDGNKRKATEYVNTLLGVPSDVETYIRAETAKAVTDLEAVKDEIATTNGKTITMTAPTAAARAQLEALGFKIEDVPGSKDVIITIPTGTPIGAVNAIQGAINGMQGKNIGIGIYKTEYLNTVRVGAIDGKSYPGVTPQARGSVLDFYADGGMRENHVAQIAPAGSWRVWAEDESGGESYIPLSPTKRPRSRKIAEETVRRLGGDPAAIQWNANGSLSDWRYDPGTGSLYSTSDAAAAGKKTKKVKGKSVDYYDLGAVERKLWDLGKATAAWNRNLEKVADRAGTDVAQALASMGEDGLKIAAKMATGTDKYVASMSIALRNLEATASASLKAFTVDLNHAVGNQSLFQENLAKLAAQGYGSLAAHLAGQNDETAYQLAADAVSSRSKADKANKATAAADKALTPDQLGQLVEIIAAITTKTTSLHAVAGKTGLGEDEIIAVANKAKQQISKSLGGKAARFLSDLGKANRGLAYENGGIRAGMYATSGGIIRFAEPSTRGEAYIPLSPSKRRTALPVLSDVATRFGVGLTDASAGRTVYVNNGSYDTNVSVTPVRTGATASDIGAQVGRSVRRARRGGVAARG